jgi:hypothetical protein
MTNGVVRSACAAPNGIVGLAMGGVDQYNTRPWGLLRGLV